MINSNELRIGNLIQESDIGILEVKNIDNNYISGWVNGVYGYAKVEDCSPILLTEEWIFKFGFEVLPSKHTNKTFNKGLLSIVLCGNYQYKNGRTYFNSWRILESQPKYVHQLQNLYFALTSQELTIKDDVGN